MPRPIHLIILTSLLTIVAGSGSGPLAASGTESSPGGVSTSERVDTSELSVEVERLRTELATLAGSKPYIVIDITHNRLQLRRGAEVVRDAVCATGSGKVLYGDKARHAWRFNTPRRVFYVERKVRDPIWKKPVWAFVEKNDAAPVLPWEFSRFDRTTLGEFALELQDSYAIHGTLYPSLLGRHITHGCVRLDDEALAHAYSLARVGTPVYVY